MSLRLHLNLACAMALWTVAPGAGAHDTWFERVPNDKKAPRGSVTLALGTGNRFPVFEFTVGAASLQQQGCRLRSDESAKTVPLRSVRDGARSLVLSAALRPLGAVSCWAQQQPFDVEIPPQTVALYFKEINAPAAVREAWSEMHARGVGWKERYAKHARIELGDDASPPPASRTTGMAMDALLETGLPVKVGASASFQILRDGQPLPDFAVEFRSDLSPIGIWKKTDAQGRVSFEPPLAANWLLRGTDLRVSATVPDTWDSRFITLAFEAK